MVFWKRSRTLEDVVWQPIRQQRMPSYVEVIGHCTTLHHKQNPHCKVSDKKPGIPIVKQFKRPNERPNTCANNKRKHKVDIQQ